LFVPSHSCVRAGTQRWSSCTAVHTPAGPVCAREGHSAVLQGRRLVVRGGRAQSTLFTDGFVLDLGLFILPRKRRTCVLIVRADTMACAALASNAKPLAAGGPIASFASVGFGPGPAAASPLPSPLLGPATALTLRSASDVPSPFGTGVAVSLPPRVSDGWRWWQRRALPSDSAIRPT
jgi:hypothetical protein